MSKIPINLAPLPVSPGMKILNLNQMLSMVASHLEASITASNISFFITSTVDPQSDQGLVFNSSQNLFKRWDGENGKYVPIAPISVGDSKLSFISGDDVTNGWVQLDGRNINNVLGVTQNQKSNLETMFGANGTLPTIQPPTDVSGLPAKNSIKNITIAPTAPTNGVISGISIGSPPVQAEVEALRDDTEILRDSVDSLNNSVILLRDKTDAINSALLGSSSINNVNYKVFCGYP